MNTLPLASRAWEFLDPRSQRWYPAQVPGCIHLDLRRNGLIPDPFYGSNERALEWIELADWTYRTTFDADAATLEHKRVELVADGLDTLATITLNGHAVARTDNMFTGYRFPVRDLLRAGSNALVVTFGSPRRYIEANRSPDDFHEWNDRVGGASLLRKEQCSFGWDWGPRFPTSGVWRDIRLEAWSGTRLGQVKLTQAHAARMAQVTLHWTAALVGAGVPTADFAGWTFRSRLSLGRRRWSRRRRVTSALTVPGPATLVAATAAARSRSTR